MRTKKIIITLVHGTFANSNKWTQQKSVFCNTLFNLFDNNITINQFKWSGKNDHQSRIKASFDFNEYISKIEQATNSEHYIISHSHGGNIVDYGEKISHIQNTKLAGKIYLATPFVDVQKRNIETSKHIIRIVLPIIVLIGYFTFAGTTNSENNSYAFDNFITFFIGLSLPILSFVFFNYFYNYLVSFQERKHDEIHQVGSSIPSLSIIHMLDEIRILFKIQNIFNSIPIAIYSLLLSFDFRKSLFILIPALIMYLFRGGTPPIGSIFILTILIVGIVLSSITFLLISNLLLNHIGSFGFTSPFTNIVLKITTNSQNSMSYENEHVEIIPF